MLIEFTVKNYRSFRDEATLSMEATGASTLKSVLIPYGGMRILPGAAIYGKNGGGKSNVIRAFWLAVQFIRNAQKTQHEKAAIPVVPFCIFVTDGTWVTMIQPERNIALAQLQVFANPVDGYPFAG